MRVLGFYREFPATFLVDMESADSVVSLHFLQQFRLPQTWVTPAGGGVVYGTAQGPVTVPSAGGFYQSVYRFRVGLLQGYDVVLGRDWCAALSVRAVSTVLPDPDASSMLPPGHLWQAGIDVPDPFTVFSGRVPAGRRVDELAASPTAPPSTINFPTVGEDPSFSSGPSFASPSGAGGVSAPACASCARASSVNGSALCAECSLSTLDLALPVQDRVVPPVRQIPMCSSCAMVRRLGVDTQCSTCSFANDEHDAVLVTADADPSQAPSLTDAVAAAVSLQGYEALSRDQIAARLAAHGIYLPTRASLDHLKDRYLMHLLNGDCALSPSSLACSQICSLLETSQQDRRQAAQLMVLRSLQRNIALKPLRRFFECQGIAYDPSAKVSALRRRLRHYISDLQRGKMQDARHARYTRLRSAQADAHDELLSDIRSKWPQLVPAKFKDELVRLFREETGSAALATFTCACCSVAASQHDRHIVPWADLPLHLLRPRDPAPHSVLDNIPELQGVLLDRHGLDIHSRVASLCATCHSSLKRSSLPSCALANGLWLGDIPPELQGLTPIEEAMIARCRAKSWIVHLKPEGMEKSDVVLPNMQRALKGHIIVHPQRPGALATLLPPPMEEFLEPICIIFVGDKPPSRQWLAEKAKPLAVNKDRVHRALSWLKLNNPLYADVEINHELLNAIPPDGILPYNISTLPQNPAHEVLTARYDSGQQLDPSQPGSTPLPFSSVVITDVDGSAPSNELRAAALRHVKEKGGGYIQIPHEPVIENEFCNPELFPKIFPTLFPYGRGGFEDRSRQSRLSFKKHAQHLMSLTDKRFQRHYSFLFIVFNILQRREVLLRSSLKVKNSSFDHVAAEFAQINQDTLATVCQRISEDQYATAQNDDERRVFSLMRQVNLIGSTVPGTSGAKLAMRNRLRAMMMQHGLPSFFVTINPADVYNPLVRFLAGEEIDIDRLDQLGEADYWSQSVLVAKDPFAAARFFNIYIKAFIKTLLGFDVQTAEAVAEGGILGHVKGYFGCVETQGRGTLHCHMVVWLEGALNPNEIREKYLAGDTDFATRLIAFLDDTISNSVPDLPADMHALPSDGRHPCSHRGVPLDISPDVYETCKARDLHHLVSACQIHRHSPTCYKYCRPGEKKECRFDLAPDNVHACTEFSPETGEICLRCLDGMVNNFNTSILRAMRCNMDIKFIGSGESAKAVLYYITDYITKSELKTHIAYAALELAVRRLGEFHQNDNDETVYAKRLLQRCAFSILTHQEMSGQQVATFLLDFEDCFSSHEFANLMWPSLERFLEQQLPSPECSFRHSQKPDSTSSSDMPAGAGDTAESDLVVDDAGDEGSPDIHDELPEADLDPEDNEVPISTDSNGQFIRTSNQLADYVYRGSLFDNVCIWDFVSQVHKVRVRRSSHGDDMMEDEDDAFESFDVASILDMDSRARPSAHFLRQHMEYGKKWLTVRQPRKRRVPVPIGPRLPRRDREEEYPRYCRLMLLMFKPWRSVHDLRGRHLSWPAAFAAFREDAPANVVAVMDNMQILHECKDSRDDHFRMRAHLRARWNIGKEWTRNSDAAADELAADESELDILQHVQEIERRSAAKSAACNANVLECVDAARKVRYGDSQSSLANIADDVTFADSNAVEKLWEDEYKARRAAWRESAMEEGAETANASAASGIGHVAAISTLAEQIDGDLRVVDAQPILVDGNRVVVSQDEHSKVINDLISEFTLNEQQERAFRIVADHVVSQAHTSKLRMFLGGAGGTGKSRVIDAISALFACRGEQRRFRLASFTGVAARNISGMTLHAALSLDKYTQAEKIGSKTNIELVAMWRGVDYLFIDEISMVGCKLLARVNLALMLAKESKSPFGNINIIFAGDFAQLPAVRDPRLYAAVGSGKPNSYTVMGKLLWLLVDCVVVLRTSMRHKEDLRFATLLDRLRDGVCTEADYELLKGRLIGKTHDELDNASWASPMTIVYDNATKDALNVAATEAFASATGRELHWYYAIDRHKGLEIANADLRAHLASLSSGETEQRMGKIPLVIGMRIIVSQNFDVAGGIVNGSVGILKKIRYYTSSSGHRHLRSCVVELIDSQGTSLPGLDEKEAAILLDTKPISIVNPFSGRTCRIQRQQVPIQPGYVLTSHRAQGQTYDRIVVDLQGCRSLEAAYVMLSRCRTLNGVVILRPFDFRRICVLKADGARTREQRRLDILDLHGKMRTYPKDTLEYRLAHDTLVSLGWPRVPDAVTWSADEREQLRSVQFAERSLDAPGTQTGSQRWKDVSGKRQRLQ